MYEILSFISRLTMEIISRSGYGGITFLMALQSACIPIPSEIIMPFSGYLVFSGRFSFIEVVFWGTFGNLIGSLAAYFFGFYGGRALLEKYGKYFFVFSHDLKRAESWFLKYGSWGIVFSRMLPVVRTFISLPAGIARMPVWKFSLCTFFGSLPWSFVLAYAGLILGKNWKSLERYFMKLDWLIVILIATAGAWWIWKKYKEKKSTPAPKE
jgi:membrane protein DedA with SNARE-associated domain